MTTVEHPAVEAWTEHRVDLDAVKAAKLATVDGQAVTEDGEVVEGITRRTPPPSSFAVKPQRSPLPTGAETAPQITAL